jgi:3-methyl-2-oxobutanoate hydroxymethyltransferase
MRKMTLGSDGARSGHKVTVPQIRASKATGTRLVAVTAYDFTMARLVDQGGVDIVLVGDSLGMVFQGLESTLPVTLEEVCYHGRAVARAKLRAHLVGDMPFMSYQASVSGAVESAGRLLKEGAFESVKLEGGEEIADRVFEITRLGIPVMGHIGMQPQSVHAYGGYRVQGRSPEDANQIVANAKALESAGAYAIVVEAVPAHVAEQVTKAVSIPTIGIGAGSQCDGQVLVCTDLLGMSPGAAPKFVKRFADVGAEITGAIARYAEDVRSGAFPSPEHAYGGGEVPLQALGRARR